MKWEIRVASEEDVRLGRECGSCNGEGGLCLHRFTLGEQYLFWKGAQPRSNRYACLRCAERYGYRPHQYYCQVTREKRD